MRTSHNSGYVQQFPECAEHQTPTSRVFGKFGSRSIHKTESHRNLRMETINLFNLDDFIRCKFWRLQLTPTPLSSCPRAAYCRFFPPVPVCFVEAMLGIESPVPVITSPTPGPCFPILFSSETGLSAASLSMAAPRPPAVGCRLWKPALEGMILGFAASSGTFDLFSTIEDK